MSTTIRQCTCKHQFQDATYGKQNRVMNAKLVSDKNNPKFRCTVCAKEHS